jgi:hypothetical protein
MARVADDDHLKPLAAVSLSFEMNLRDQGTRRIDDSKSSLSCLFDHSRRNTVGAEDRYCALGKPLEGLHKDSAFFDQFLNDVTVVNDFMKDENRRTMDLQGPLHDFNRPNDPRAKTTRLGKNHLHRFHLSRSAEAPLP